MKSQLFKAAHIFAKEIKAANSHFTYRECFSIALKESYSMKKETSLNDLAIAYIRAAAEFNANHHNKNAARATVDAFKAFNEAIEAADVEPIYTSRTRTLERAMTTARRALKRETFNAAYKAVTGFDRAEEECAENAAAHTLAFDIETAHLSAGAWC